MRGGRPDIRGSGFSRGIVLPLSIVYLIIISILAVLLIEVAGLQFRAAGNDQHRVVAEQAARAVMHELTTMVTPSPDPSVAGRTCGIGDRRSECDSAILARPRMLDALGRDAVVYSIERRHSAELEVLALREPESRVSSAAVDRFARYELEVSVLSEPGRPVSVGLVRGFFQRLPSGPGR